MSYYLMHRDWMENPALTGEPFCRRAAWAWLIENASFEPRQYVLGSKIIELDRGELVCSLRFMATTWGWGKDKVSAFLRVLERLSMITLKTATASQTAEKVITICNYTIYQVSPDSKQTDNQTITRQQADSKQTNLKKEKEEKKETPKGVKKENIRAHQIPSDWKPNPSHAELATELGYVNGQMVDLLDGFKDHAKANGKIHVDWDAAFRTWIRNDLKFHGDPRKRSHAGKQGGLFGGAMI